MKINLQSPIEEVQIQIVPLIDVIFCILTFFLLAALQFTREQAISVDLPKASTGTTPQVEQKRLLVTLDSNGQIYVEQQPVLLDQLPEALKIYLQTNPNGIMVLNASRLSSYNNVVQVLDKMREVGGDRVALATLPGASDQPASSSPLTPNFPTAPGSTPLPGTTPIAPFNPFGIPDSAITPAPSQFPLSPTVPGPLDRQGINPQLFPTVPAPQPTASSGRTNASP